jgi:hypothetical protein
MVGNAKIATLSASKLTGALPAISGAALTNVTSSTGIDTVSADPTISTNPSGGVGTIQLNQVSGEMYVCTDATAGSNIWVNVGGGSGDVQLSYAQGTVSGYVMGGESPARDVIDKFTFASDANATDVGDLPVARFHPAGTNSTTHGYCAGGSAGGGVGKTEIEKFTFASNADATDVGDLTLGRYHLAGQTSETHGYSSAGYRVSPGVPNPVNVIDKFSFAADGNATDVGDVFFTRQAGAGTSSTTHGYVAGGEPGNPSNNIIDKFSFATDGNSTDVGNLSVARYAAAGQSSQTHGYTSGGQSGSASDVIDKFTFSSDADATDVGNLTVARNAVSGQSSSTHGYTSGGSSNNNIIEKFTFASNANATDVGDLTVGRQYPAGTQY